jgi:hypothetical protein
MDWTGVQVTLWQLSREKSLIAKRSEMKGNSSHTSKANFESAFVSSNPPTPASQCGLPLRHASEAIVVGTILGFRRADECNAVLPKA